MSFHYRSRPVHVFIVDDHPMLLEGTQNSLERASGIVVVGTAVDGRSAIERISTSQPDVLVLDMRLPDMSGVDVARYVREHFPQIGILILTGFDDVHYARASVQLDIQGYLLKTSSSNEIVAAVRRVAAGGKVFDPEVVRAIEDSTGVAESLTAREVEVLQLVAHGSRNTDIAQELGLSIKTVEFHMSNLMSKLGARSRSDAVRAGYQKGILRDDR
ncbi:MAG TPA: response regulator transcription factor [Nitrolancea sp.]|nr:response regulator transcription factor [Nitrolancea sp.]